MTTNPRESDLRTCPVRVLVTCDGQCATCATEPEPEPVNQYDEQYEGTRR
jgi:hypothetical protein